MFKQLVIAAASLLVASAAFSAVDINKASQAELEAVKGIGPGLSTRIVGERSKAPFKDWSDLSTRVKGVGGKNAAKFSSGGLTVNGAAYTGGPVATAPKASKKPAAVSMAASGARKT
jgi:competence protein ComEA